jgi:DNA-binding PucR family transcriptional regulator
MNITDISTTELRRALRVKEQIESLQKELNSLLGVSTGGRRGRIVSNGVTPGRKTRRRMSAAARARIAAAQRARWAKVKAGKG